MISNYEKLFGTPEKAARTLKSLDVMHCEYCLIRDYCGDSCLLYGRDDALLEWLKVKDEVIAEPDIIRNELIDSGLLKDDA